MNAEATPTQPIFDAGREVAARLEELNVGFLRRRRLDDGHTNLLAALDDLNGWLNDGRPYEKRFHQQPWKTMAADVTAVFSTRGSAVVKQTPSITALAQQLATPDLGDDPPRRAQCRNLVTEARSELAQPDTRVAALDDLISSAQDPLTPAGTVTDLVDVLTACVVASGRTATAPLRQVEGVLDNDRGAITEAGHDLGSDGQPEQDHLGADAELSLDDRLAIARRVLQRSEPVGRQVIWLVYDNAEVRKSTIVIGPVTFYDGPRLVDAVANGTELYHQVDQGDGSYRFDPTPLPLELPRPDEPAWTRWHDWPPQREKWVAVRVDLGLQQLPDPVRTAIQQAESVVRLAGFHLNGTPWQRLNGHKYVRDDVLRGQTIWWTVPGKHYHHDNTDLLIEDLQRHIGPHLPVQEPHLQDLLDAAAVLDEPYDNLDTTSIVHSVRVLEKISGLLESNWQKYLIDNYSIEWARDSITGAITEAINGVTERPQLNELLKLSSMPTDTDLIKYTAGGHSINLNVAVAALPGLAAELPTDHPAARQVRTVAARTATSARLKAWIEEERATYQRLIDRLARCRNSLAHGGPISDDTARTVQVVAWAYAKQTTSLALYSVAKGNDLGHDQQQRRQDHELWLSSLPALLTVADAFR